MSRTRNWILAVAGVVALLAVVMLFVGGEGRSEAAAIEATGALEPARIVRVELPTTAVSEKRPGVQRGARSVAVVSVAGLPTSEGATLSLQFISAFDSRSLPDVEFRVGVEADDHLPDGAEKWRRDGRSGADGRASLGVPPKEELWIWIDHADEHGHGEFEVEPILSGGVRELVLSLATDRDLTWFGRVELDGEPVENAKVSFFDTETDDEPTLINELRTDALGLVQLEAWTWRWCDVRVNVPGVGIALVSVEEGHSTIDSAQSILLWPLGALNAEVKDVNGAPLSGIAVRLGLPTYALSSLNLSDTNIRRVEWTAETDVHGLAVLADVVAGTSLDLTLSADGRDLLQKQRAFALVAGESLEKEFVLGASGSVIARVVDPSGRALEGVTVWLVENNSAGTKGRLFNRYDEENRLAERTSDAAGIARFEEVPFGSWYAGVAGGAEGPLSLAVPLVLGAQTPAADLVLQVVQGETVVGRVVDEAGQGIAAIDVSLFGQEFAGGPTATSDTEGRFEVKRLLDGNYRLSMRMRNSMWLFPRPMDVAVPSEELLIVLSRGGSLRGVIRDAISRELVEYVELTAYAYESEQPHRQRAFHFVTEGEFEIGGLDSGTYALLATSEDGRIGIVNGLHVNRPAATGGIELLLARGIPVHMRYEGPASECDILVTTRGVTISYTGHDPGVTETFLSPPGMLDLQIMPKDGEPYRTQFLVDADKDAELVIR